MSLPRFAPLLLLATGCGYHHSPGCETELSEVDDDDDDLGDIDFSAADVLADIAGRRTFPGSLTDGTVVTGELEVTRADGAAVFADRTPFDNKRLRVGIGDSYQLNYVMCDDTLTVPVDVTFATEDGALSMALEGAAEASSQMHADDPARHVRAGTVGDPAPHDPVASLGFADDRLEYAQIRGADDDGSFYFPAVEVE